MITFRERLGKPSAAVQAMIDGLREMEGKGAMVNMGFFFLVSDRECFACAATAAVMKATGCDWGHARAELSSNKGLLWPAFAKVLGPDVEPDDLEYFEKAMDRFRMGRTCDLFHYFGVDYPDLAADWELWTCGWEDQLPRVEVYRDKLIALGL